MSDESTGSAAVDTGTSAEATPANATEAPVTEGQETAKPKAKAPQFHKFKIGDEEVSLTQADIERDYKKWKGSDQKFRESSAKEKAVADFFEALEKDPEKTLNDKRLPLNKKALAEKWLVEQLEAELNPVDPRETDLQARERKLKDWEDAQAKTAKDAEELEAKETETKEMASRKDAISKTLSDAMASTQLSKHPESAAATLREMALYMRAAKERGEEPTPEELVEHIHNNRFNQFYTLAHAMEGEELIEFLSEDIVNKIRKADLARLRAGRGDTQQHRTTERVEPKDKPATFIDPTEARIKARGW